MKVYLDHAASTPVRDEVLQAMLPFFKESFGNASSIHTFGQEARIALEEARRKVAASIGCTPSEILFTSGGTESDNWAIRSVLAAAKGGKTHIITSAVEHPAVRNTVLSLQKQGAEVSFLASDSTGRVDPEEIKRLIRPETAIVSCQYVNNEVGTLMPVREIGEICREHAVPFHVDAVQAFGKIPLDMSELPVDLLSLSAHKIYGPKGIGALYIRKGTELPPMILGGAQERDKRAGTENVPAIVGFGKAAEMAVSLMEEDMARIRELQDLMVGELGKIPGLHFNGPLSSGRLRNGIPGYVNLRADGCLAESLLVLLDMKGIAVSAGSACSSGSLSPSHVLLACGLSVKEAGESIRVTLGAGNTREEILYFTETLGACVSQLRRIMGGGIS